MNIVTYIYQMQNDLLTSRKKVNGNLHIPFDQMRMHVLLSICDVNLSTMLIDMDNK